MHIRIIQWLMILSMVFAVPGGSVAEYYQWQDENGIWHFTETPPPQETPYEKKETVVNEQPPVAQQSQIHMQAIPVKSAPSRQANAESFSDNQSRESFPLDRRRDFYLEYYPSMTIIERYVLAPEAMQPVSVPAQRKTYIGYYTDISDENTSKCGYCITMMQKGTGASIQSPAGGGQDFFPKNGFIDLIIENLATFQVEVEVYRH